MKAVRTLAAGAALLGSAAVFGAAALPFTPGPAAESQDGPVELRFAVERGGTARFRQTHTTLSELLSITDVINGAERPMAELPELHWEVVETLDWRDTNHALHRDREFGTPTLVERDFERLTRARREVLGEGADSALEIGALHGLSVNLERTEDGWVATYAPEEGEPQDSTKVDEGTIAGDIARDPAWLEGLAYRPAFAGFLPDHGAAQVGDQWEADLDAWRAVLRPTGDMVYLDQAGTAVDDSIDTDLLANLKGTITCTLTGVEGDAATIGVEVRVTSRKQVEGPLERDDAGIETASFQRSIRLRGAYDGTLVWDTAQHRARSFDLTGKATWNIDETTLMNFENGTEWAQGKLMELAADHTLTATID